MSCRRNSVSTETWYQGTADAIYQNIYTIEKANPKYVLILAGDHIYKMDYGDMLRAHIEKNADLTVGCLPVPAKESIHFGVMQVDASDRILGFQEKPKDPVTIPGEPETIMASMGIYVFTARLMYELMIQDATKPDSHHDFGKNIIPSMIDKYKVFGFRFRDKNQKPNAYWRDVGTLDAYYQANMDLIQVVPELNLYDQDWPIRTNQPQLPPPKFVFREEATGRRGEAHDSIVCPGCDRQRRTGGAQHPVAERAHQQLCPGRGFDPVQRRRCGPRFAHSTGDHRQGGQDSARLDHRLRRRARSPSRLHDHRCRRRRDRQGGVAGDV